MGVAVRDILKANLVLIGLHLLDKPEAVTAFRSHVDTDVQVSGAGLVLAPASSGMGATQTLSLNRDRISLDLAPDRSVITKEYPSTEEPQLHRDFSRLSEVASFAISNTSEEGGTLRAFGYNIEVVYEQDTDLSAFNYLAKRLFQSESTTKAGWQLIGGAAKLSYEGDNKLWNLIVEPRFNDKETNRIFLSLNLHKVQQSSPSQDEIRDSLYEAWSQATAFAMQLDCN